jgi:hypothetical protein
MPSGEPKDHDVFVQGRLYKQVRATGSSTCKDSLESRMTWPSPLRIANPRARRLFGMT